MDKINKLTINKIQKSLSIKTDKTTFLRMIFPTTLKNGDNAGLVDFIFNSDTSFQNNRSIFINGNMIKNKKKQTYRRAYQAVLNFIADKMNNYSCLSDMTEFLTKNFPNITQELIDSLQEIDNDIYPEDFRKILNNSENLHYKLTCLILWSVFGERINLIHFSINLSKQNTNNSIIYKYSDIIKYFNDNLNDIDEIESVEFVFQTGIRWINDDERVKIIQKLLDSNIKLSIIISDINHEFISAEMNNPNRTFIKFSYIHEMWKEFCIKNNNLVNVKISPLPILHSYYSFNMKNNKSSVFYILYTYGNIGYKRRLTQTLNCTSEHYQTLKDEFKYLWELSKKIN
ncbi:MAG: hypothetical protein NC177_12620 [Ruminococcus flavefaciens]|nr:hypothetical protein [Ruminococcus flavefaciens]